MRAWCGLLTIRIYCSPIRTTDPVGIKNFMSAFFLYIGKTRTSELASLVAPPLRGGRFARRVGIGARQFRAHKLRPSRGNLCDLRRIFASAKILASDFCVRKNPSAYYAKA